MSRRGLGTAWRASVTWLVLAAGAACGSRTALTLASSTDGTDGPGGTNGDAAAGDGAGGDGAVNCSDPVGLCAGKCGVLPRVCGGKVDCGGCPAGESCGAGGTPNVCAKCTPNCAGKACGDPDGCSSKCNVPTCGRSQSCVQGECVCTAAAASVAAGGGHTCVLTRDGGLQCWGENYSGQIGTGDSVDRNVPVKVSGLAAGVTSAAAGASHTCAVMTGGDLFCWGDNNSGQLGNGSLGGVVKLPRPVPGIGGVQAVAAGAAHTCALTRTGAVYCWGSNAQGQLGIGPASGALVPTVVPGLGSGVAAIATSYSHTCAATQQGDLLCWGANTTGQLGDGTTNDSSTPVRVVGLAGSAVAVSTGFSSTCAITAGGSTQCWGNNASGQLGDGTEESSLKPVFVAGPAMSPTALTHGVLFACALGDGGLSCWGDNVSGQLGDGTDIQHRVPIPTLLPDSGTVSVGSGDEHTCAVSRTGCVVCWGDNLFGQLGNGQNVDSFLPVIPVGY